MQKAPYASTKPRNEGGKYAVVLPGPKFFEFLMVEETMEFKTSAANPAKDLQVIQSKENDVFYGYMKFIQERGTNALLLMLCCKTALPPPQTSLLPVKASKP